jgi:GT2 family glycosyltransferase
MGLRADTPEVTASVPEKLPRVAIVIVNWNGKHDLLECLSSLKELDYPEDRCRLLIVDNGSRDGSVEAATEVHPEAVVIQNPNNLGYARAVNQGVECARSLGAEYVWILNNDVVVERDALRVLVKAAAEHEAIAVVGPVIHSHDAPRIVSHTGYSISLWTGRMRSLRFGEDLFRDPGEAVADVDSILGCSNLVKVPVFEEVGPFRSLYNLYFEETDFNLRVRRRGYRVVLARGAKVYHKGSATMNRRILRKAWLLLRNLLLFELLNARWWHLLVFIPYFSLLHLPYFVLRGSVHGTRTAFSRSWNRPSG